MTLPRPRTVRARLTLFTMLVTGVLLALIVLIVDIGVRRTLLGSVDSELQRQARGMANGRPGRPRGPEGPPDRRREGPEERDPRNPEGPDPSNPGQARSGASGHDTAGGNPESLADRHPVDRRTAPIGIVRTASDDDVRPLDFGPNSGDERFPAYDPGALARARSGTATFSEFERDGRVYRLYTFPIRRDGAIVRVNQIPSELTTVISSLDGLRRTLLQIVLPIG
ncbi:hypothetical protein EON81_24485, partial [bacterium]